MAHVDILTINALKIFKSSRGADSGAYVVAFDSAISLGEIKFHLPEGAELERSFETLSRARSDANSATDAFFEKLIAVNRTWRKNRAFPIGHSRETDRFKTAIRQFIRGENGHRLKRIAPRDTAVLLALGRRLVFGKAFAARGAPLADFVEMT